MLQIRRMRFDDIPYALRLTDQEKWGVTRADLLRILKLDPRGSFIAAKGSRRVGLITTTRYGRKLAWIGNVIVDRNYRGAHIGQSLVQIALEHLQKSNVKHIALYCFDENVRFYRRLGFIRDAPFVRLRGKSTRAASLAHMAQQTLPLGGVLSLDRRAFGANRSQLIRMTLRSKSGWYLSSSNSYMLVKESKEMCEIGPWVSSKQPMDQASELLDLAVRVIGEKPIEVSCLRNHPAYGLFRKHGFRVMSHGYRMYLSRIARIGDHAANFALGFLDKG
ncbi:MAG: GNAT family N-acetyltransferase [Candidatus Bathyarchaeia archaeon]